MSRLIPVTPTILIVDDEPHIRAALRRSLQVEQYHVVEAGSAHEALVFLWSNHADVMITDHSMPHMNGLELLRKARKLRPTMSHIMLTGAADVATASAIVNEKLVSRFLLKPWEMTELRISVRMAIQEARAPRPAQSSSVNANR